MSNKTQLQTNNSELQDILNIIAALPNAADLGVGTYIWQKSDGSTTEYVVSDDPSAYPDDGEQGGFTYKKIQATETTEITPGTADQTIDALTLLLNTLTIKGVSLAYGSFTPNSYTTAARTFYHNLGHIPSTFILCIKSMMSTLQDGFIYGGMTVSTSNYMNYIYNANHVAQVNITAKTETYIRIAEIMGGYEQGYTYYWFAL